MIVPQIKNSHNMLLVSVLVLCLFAAATAQLQLNAPLIPEYTFLNGVGNASNVGATVAGNFVFTADALRIWGLDMRRAANDQVPFQYALANVTMMWSWCKNSTSVDSCHFYAIAGPVVAMFSMNGSSVWLTSIVNSTLVGLVPGMSYDIDDNTTLPSQAFPRMIAPAGKSAAQTFFVLGAKSTIGGNNSTVVAYNALALSVVGDGTSWAVQLYHSLVHRLRLGHDA